jgi:hypothetical protein
MPYIGLVPANEVKEWLLSQILSDTGSLHNPDHSHLMDADIQFMWVSSAFEKKGRYVLGQAEEVAMRAGGWQKARMEQQMHEWFGEVPKFIIPLAADYCSQCSDLEFCALVEHELYHIAQANGWYRCAITIVPTLSVSPQFTLVLTNSDSSAAALPSYIPAVPGSVWIWGAQAERRDGASSYIPTSGAEGSRAADICTTPTNADFVTTTGGTVLVTCLHPHSIQSVSGVYNALACAAVLDNSVAGAYLRLAYRQITYNNGQAKWATSDAAGVSQSLEIYSLSPVRDSEQSAIFSFDTPSLNLKLFDGFNWYSRSVTSLPPALNRLAIGRSYIGPENWFNGHIKKVVYWPTALSTEEMERAISYL